MTERELTAEPATPQARRYTVGYPPQRRQAQPTAATDPQGALAGRTGV